jgi:hypothetical protein
MFTTYLQLTMAGLKIKFSKNIFDWLAQSLASKGSTKHLLGQKIDISEKMSLYLTFGQIVCPLKVGFITNFYKYRDC